MSNNTLALGTKSFKKLLVVSICFESLKGKEVNELYQGEYNLVHIALN
jgi:hypothetical protein